MNLQLEYELVRFRDDIKSMAEAEYDYASINNNAAEGRLELQFSETLLKLYSKIDKIIQNERIRK